jgi:SAM-dependent methyltransferase
MPLTVEMAPDAAVSNFRKYSAVYDLLYRDKDYEAEARYVAQTLRSVQGDARTVLELGCGTGRHGRLLAAKGFAVHGVERSPDMVALAQAAARTAAPAPGSFTCEAGDLRTIALGRTFDAVIALFHVVSYQTTDDDLRATFAAAAQHLAPGGVLLFDVWHGPAVLAQRPERRVKTVGDARLEVVRTARPELDADRCLVKVSYDMECRDRRSGEVERFSEDHLIRYLFPQEIEALAAQHGMRVVASEEFLTGLPPTQATWGVMYVLRKRDRP